MYRSPCGKYGTSCGRETGQRWLVKLGKAFPQGHWGSGFPLRGMPRIVLVAGLGFNEDKE
jgi:hypothetical protein